MIVRKIIWLNYRPVFVVYRLLSEMWLYQIIMFPLWENWIKLRFCLWLMSLRILLLHQSELNQDERKLAVVLNRIFINLLTFYSVCVFVMLNPATKVWGTPLPHVPDKVKSFHVFLQLTFNLFMYSKHKTWQSCLHEKLADTQYVLYSAWKT